MKKMLIITLVSVLTGCAGYYPAPGVFGLQTSTGLCTYPVNVQGQWKYEYKLCG